MTQLSIDFAGLARKSDPVTSKLAASRIRPTLGARQADCLRYIAEHPGCVGSEVEKHNTQLRKRLKELEDLLLIHSPSVRVSTCSNHPGKQWYLTPLGQSTLKGISCPK